MNTLMYYISFVFIFFTITFFIKKLLSYTKNINLDSIQTVTCKKLSDYSNKSSNIYRNRMTSGQFTIYINS
jgi:hypothetical protein